MEEYFQANRKLWDAWTAINASSEFYDVAGLRLEYLHEFPFIPYKFRPFLVQGGDGFWRYSALEGGLPLMFSIKAIKTKR
jgi:hypothetical protein